MKIFGREPAVVLAFISALLQAGFSLLIALGHDVPTSTQVAISTLLTGAVALFVRTQVTAPVPKS